MNKNKLIEKNSTWINSKMIGWIGKISRLMDELKGCMNI